MPRPKPEDGAEDGAEAKAEDGAENDIDCTAFSWPSRLEGCAADGDRS